MTKLNGKYFVTDCHNNRLIWSNSKTAHIETWNTVDVELSGAHSVASDGDIYLLDNSGANEVLVLDSNLKFKQRLSGVVSRPHKVIFDAETNAFFVIATPYIYRFEKINGQLVMMYQKQVDYLVGSYVRSIKIINGEFYIISGNGYINVAAYKDGSFSVVRRYQVPNSMYSMNDILKVGEYFYLSATQNSSWEVIPSLVRVKDLANLITGNYEDIYSLVGCTSVPYSLDLIDNEIVLTENRDHSRIITFDPDQPQNYQTLHLFGPPNSSNLERFNMYPY